MFGLFKSSAGSKDIWTSLDAIDQFSALEEESQLHPIVIFKHSTRCSISSMAKNRLEGDWSEKTNDATIYYLDLIAHRDISNAIADRTGVQHESPQIIVLDKGKAVFNASHSAINTADIVPFI